ncbi:MAG: hypothetical protein ACE5FS_03475 [Paracoccaceae bacterium]
MRYSLRDTNPYHYNCGHYPDWEVREDLDGVYASREEAQAVADRRNDASDRRWQHFLNG